MLIVKNLHVYYGLIEALKGISFGVKTEQIVSLIGSNGVGKTSTLDALLDSIRRTGEINLLGYEMKRHLTHTLVQKGITLAPERRRAFINLAVEENPKIGAYNNSENYERLREQMYKLLPRLAGKKHILAGNLSGGGAQMLAISRALISEPKFLMLDEPSLGLAPKTVSEVFDIIVRLKEKGITILLVEQNAFSALRISNYAYALENGHIVVQDETQNLIHSGDVKGKYLGL